MMNMKDVSSDITPAKISEVKPVEAPKEIGENKSNYADAPKEIGETSAKAQDMKTMWLSFLIIIFSYYNLENHQWMLWISYQQQKAKSFVN